MSNSRPVRVPSRSFRIAHENSSTASGADPSGYAFIARWNADRAPSKIPSVAATVSCTRAPSGTPPVTVSAPGSLSRGKATRR